MIGQYGLIMVISKLASVAMVGRYSLALAVTTPVVTLCLMQLRNVQVTDVAAADRFRDYLSSRLLAVAVAVGLLAGGVIVFRPPVHLAATIVAVGCVKGIDGLSDIVYGQLQICDRFHLIGVSSLIRAAASVAVFAVVLGHGGPLEAAVVAQALLSASILVAFDLQMIRRGSRATKIDVEWKPATLKALGVTALPLAVASSLSAVSAGVSRYFLQSFRGSDDVGFFAVAYAPMTILSAFGVAVVQAAITKASVALQGGDVPGFTSVARRARALLCLSSASVLVLFVCCGGTVLETLFTARYAHVSSYVCIMVAGVLLSNVTTVSSTALTAARAFKTQMGIRGATLCVQLLACAIAIPRFGALGAAWAEFGTILVWAALSEILGRAELRLRRLPTPGQP
jgi:O-antigen/teichoic acid export membrane protein